MVVDMVSFLLFSLVNERRRTRPATHTPSSCLPVKLLAPRADFWTSAAVDFRNSSRAPPARDPLPRLRSRSAPSRRAPASEPCCRGSDRRPRRAFASAVAVDRRAGRRFSFAVGSRRRDPALVPSAIDADPPARAPERLARETDPSRTDAVAFETSSERLASGSAPAGGRPPPTRSSLAPRRKEPTPSRRRPASRRSGPPPRTNETIAEEK